MKPGKTQKAKGIALLNDAGFLFHAEINPLPFDLITELGDFDSLKWEGERFARPCPITPCHGFVDSRPVSSLAEARALFLEARKEDKQAELILMPFVDATYSAIWTPGILTVGVGNDGATSGKGAVTIHTSKKAPLTNESVIEASGIVNGDVPYFEFVRNEASHYVVQMRGGPDISDSGDDYLEGALTVKAVVQPNGEDLLAWKARCENFKPGTLVYHDGGALSSHYGIHCKTNGIPYFTTRKPKVGAKIELCGCKKKPKGVQWCPVCDGYVKSLPELDVSETLVGLSLGVEFQCSYRDAVLMVLGALHNSSYFGKKESRLFGLAVSLALKLGFAACFGEARHKIISGLDRKQIYDRAWSDMGASVKRFNEIRAKFFEGSWKPGYGGKAWGACADATASLWNSVVRFVRSKTDADLNQVKDALNLIINQAHNNGWWFNKFFKGHSEAMYWFDTSAACPVSPLIMVCDKVFRILKDEGAIGGLMAQVEKATGAGATSSEVESTYKGYQLRQAGALWLVLDHNGDTLKEVKHLRDAARFLNELYGKPTTKFFVGATYAAITRIINRHGATASGDTWIIPDLNKTDLKESAKKTVSDNPIFKTEPRKVLQAQASDYGKMIHFQIRTSAASGYEKRDVLSTPEIRKALTKALALNPATSFAVTDRPYAGATVGPDGIYLADLKVIALKNFIIG